MKWRLVSELSNEQRDGRWWIFGSNEFNNNIAEALRWNGESWFDNDGDSYFNGGTGRNMFFLSEPLPEFPKPQKMEWRKFEDEWPSDGQLVFVYRTNPESNERHPEVCVCEGENLCHYGSGAYGGLVRKYSKSFVAYWMPIIPPEDE